MVMEVRVPVNVQKQDTGPVRPEYVPEKFWRADKGEVDVEGMAKSYTSLEGAFSSREVKPEPVKPVAPADKEVKPVGDPLAIKDKPAESVTPPVAPGSYSPEQMASWTQEYEQQGGLSEDTYKAIGLPRPLVDTWIAGQEALRHVARQEAFSLIGGEDKYASMSDWAQNNITKPEIDAFNKAIIGPKAERHAAISGMYARYTQAEGSPAGRQVKGRAAAEKSGLQPFESKEQWKAAMRDPKYKGRYADPAFIKQVEQRLLLSDF